MSASRSVPYNIGATATGRAAAVNYTKHDNNNTITTITERGKQRKRKKNRFGERENKNGINKNNPKIRDNITATMITVKCRRRQWEYRTLSPHRRYNTYNIGFSIDRRGRRRVSQNLTRLRPGGSVNFYSV